MLLKINKFLSSDNVSLIVNENFAINDEKFLEETCIDKNISLIGEIFKTDDSVIFSGKIGYTLTDECARCLQEFDNKIETKFQAAVVQKEDMESDEVQMVIKDGNIKMDDTIKQLIYLSFPMKSLCDKDCKGICPDCGANLNNEKCQCENSLTDPRFDKLKDLLK
ncbi:MAG: DUF177 domain-containing protein [Tissierellia bacterium]|jgi:uncharacterized protein|nr:DUF177 domain-containing protein [Tissierellia bacterium]MDD3225958.1 DUF177 domain-containing protein [Tissierellia bacterium]MDD3751112.1 DUF177 domain-containing protein [Tissierellia bacterium]MDD4046048.1 DUF177 domain-containing protein [Tissierellia bacterium]MDD4677572.1 DUF177 domain-containing protein [Tissierellia bacterium]